MNSYATSLAILVKNPEKDFPVHSTKTHSLAEKMLMVQWIYWIDGLGQFATCDVWILAYLCVSFLLTSVKFKYECASIETIMVKTNLYIIF